MIVLPKTYLRVASLLSIVITLSGVLLVGLKVSFEK